MRKGEGALFCDLVEIQKACLKEGKVKRKELGMHLGSFQNRRRL